MDEIQPNGHLEPTTQVVKSENSLNHTLKIIIWVCTGIFLASLIFLLWVLSYFLLPHQTDYSEGGFAVFALGFFAEVPIIQAGLVLFVTMLIKKLWGAALGYMISLTLLFVLPWAAIPHLHKSDWTPVLWLILAGAITWLGCSSYLLFAKNPRRALNYYWLLLSAIPLVIGASIIFTLF